MEKIKELESNWASDEKIIKDAVSRKPLFVHLSDVSNLPYDKATNILLMKQYAYVHHNEVELHDYGSYVTLWKRIEFVNDKEE